MKKTKTKSGIKGYQCKLQENYSDFIEFDQYDEIYNLAKRLGFETSEEAWEANPVIQGSTNPEDFCTVTPVNEGQQQPVQGEGFTGGEWEARDIDTKKPFVSGITKNGATQFIAFIDTNYKEKGEAEANARLIAEAKNMYSLLRQINERVEHLGNEMPKSIRGYSDKAKAILNRIDNK